MMGLLVLCVLATVFSRLSTSAEVCTNTFLPGAKGDRGETGEVGDQGKQGKIGPPGMPGEPGGSGQAGDIGHVGKMGPIGDKGDKGDAGLEGASGLKGEPGNFGCMSMQHLIMGQAGGGESNYLTFTYSNHEQALLLPGTTCDCGRYRKVVGQLDVSVSKLRNSVKFVKNVLLGIKETEERYYLLVKEPRKFREASVNCKLRGGALAMPKTSNTNRLMADYVGQAGLTRVFIGVHALSNDTDGRSNYVYADSSNLLGFTSWSPEEDLNSEASPNSSCVELLSSGVWGRVECEATMFFICEFPKSRRRGGRGGRGTPALAS